MTVQTGAKTQLGGLKVGLASDSYQRSGRLKKPIAKPPPTTNRRKNAN